MIQLVRHGCAGLFLFGATTLMAQPASPPMANMPKAENAEPFVSDENTVVAVVALDPKSDQRSRRAEEAGEWRRDQVGGGPERTPDLMPQADRKPSY